MFKPYVIVDNKGKKPLKYNFKIKPFLSIDDIKDIKVQIDEYKQSGALNWLSGDNTKSKECHLRLVTDNTKPHPLAEHVGGTSYGTSLFEEGHLQDLFEEEFECMMFGLEEE